MPFQYFGPSQTINVTDVATTISLWSLPQSRVWNKGPNQCRIRYSSNAASATLSDMVMPNSFIEVHTRAGQDWLSAICASGETATLEISSGQGD